jgi:hypothetical protein
VVDRGGRVGLENWIATSPKRDDAWRHQDIQGSGATREPTGVAIGDVERELFASAPVDLCPNLMAPGRQLERSLLASLERTHLLAIDDDLKRAEQAASTAWARDLKPSAH